MEHSSQTSRPKTGCRRYIGSGRMWRPALSCLMGRACLISTAAPPLSWISSFRPVFLITSARLRSRENAAVGVAVSLLRVRFASLLAQCKSALERISHAHDTQEDGPGPGSVVRSNWYYNDLGEHCPCG